MSVIETNLKHEIITPKRSYFYPDAHATRAEAYAMIMASVCLYPTGSSENSWHENLHAVAKKELLTIREWENFRPNKPILRQEVFVLASRAADWAHRTG